jgi:hypothetical protein
MNHITLDYLVKHYLLDPITLSGITAIKYILTGCSFPVTCDLCLRKSRSCLIGVGVKPYPFFCLLLTLSILS